MTAGTGGGTEVSSSVQSRTRSLSVPHDAAGARRARQLLANELREHLPPALLTDAVAVAGELLGNAVRHARPMPDGTIRLAWRLNEADGAVVLFVTDGGSTTQPRPQAVPPDALDGRGLAIVSALSNAWGVERDETGQTVWAVVGAREERGPVLGHPGAPH